MTTPEYTPTTDEVETHFHEWAEYLEKTEPGTYPFRTWQEAMRGFRRWLAQHDAALLRKAADHIRERNEAGEYNFVSTAGIYLHDEAATIARGEQG